MEEAKLSRNPKTTCLKRISSCLETAMMPAVWLGRRIDTAISVRNVEGGGVQQFCFGNGQLQ